MENEIITKAINDGWAVKKICDKPKTFEFTKKIKKTKNNSKLCHTNE